jgi:hypothetical protein
VQRAAHAPHHLLNERLLNENLLNENLLPRNLASLNDCRFAAIRQVEPILSQLNG